VTAVFICEVLRQSAICTASWWLRVQVLFCCAVMWELQVRPIYCSVVDDCGTGLGSVVVTVFVKMTFRTSPVMTMRIFVGVGVGGDQKPHWLWEEENISAPARFQILSVQFVSTTLTMKSARLVNTTLMTSLTRLVYPCWLFLCLFKQFTSS
jgi:hypothetical protein